MAGATNDTSASENYSLNQTNNECAHHSSRIHKQIQACFMDITDRLDRQSEQLSNELDSKFSRLEGAIKKIHGDLFKLHQEALEARADIQSIQTQQDTINDKICVFENDLDRVEIESRKKNLKIMGIPDSREDNNPLVSVVELLNKYSVYDDWRSSDFEWARRIGFRRGSRPVIVCFARLDDKIAVLRDSELRRELEHINIKIAADLTLRQRDTLEGYKQQGKKAYYKGGRLFVNDMPVIDNRPKVSADPRRAQPGSMHDPRTRQTFTEPGARSTDHLLSYSPYLPYPPPLPTYQWPPVSWESRKPQSAVRLTGRAEPVQPAAQPVHPASKPARGTNAPAPARQATRQSGRTAQAGHQTSITDSIPVRARSRTTRGLTASPKNHPTPT